MSVNVNRSVTDQFYRYKMPRLIAKVGVNCLKKISVVILKKIIYIVVYVFLQGGRQGKWYQDCYRQHGWCCQGTEQASYLWVLFLNEEFSFFFFLSIKLQCNLRRKEVLTLNNAVSRSNQVLRLWVGSPNPIWFKEWPLHCQWVSWGKQIARHAGWIHSQVCAVSGVRQSWDWFGKYAQSALVYFVMAVEVGTSPPFYVKVRVDIWITYKSYHFLNIWPFHLHWWTRTPCVFCTCVLPICTCCWVCRLLQAHSQRVTTKGFIPVRLSEIAVHKSWHDTNCSRAFVDMGTG